MHPPYFITCNVFKESHIKPSQPEFNVVLDTDLPRFHQTQDIYLAGKDYSNLNCGPKLCTIFPFPDNTVILPVWIKIMMVVIILWSQITVESRIDVFKRPRPLRSSLCNHDNDIGSEKCLSAHCASLAWCYLPFDVRAGINFYLISDRYKLDVTIACTHSSLSL